jgi:hypothetical protein
MTTTRIISWQQLVNEADPAWLFNKLNPVQYTFSNGRIFTAPNPLYGTPFVPGNPPGGGPGTLPSPGLQNDGGVLILTGDTSAWPNSPNGVAAGHLFYNDFFVICIVPGAPAPPPNTPPLFFPGITSDQLLQATTANLPTTDPGVANQLWQNGLVVCVSTGVVTPPPVSRPSLDFSKAGDSQFIPLV